MAGMVGAGAFAAVIIFLGLAAAPASAQGLVGPAAKNGVVGAPQSRDRVRVRILDNCVLTQTKPGVDGGAAPKCRCYSLRVTKAMTPEEIAGYDGRMPARLDAEATEAFATCK